MTTRPTDTIAQGDPESLLAPSAGTPRRLAVHPAISQPCQRDGYSERRLSSPGHTHFPARQMEATPGLTRIPESPLSIPNMPPQARSPFLVAQSQATDSCAAVAELHAAIWQEDLALVMFFCSSAYDLAIMAGEINRRFAGVPVIGCTSAGGFGPDFYGQYVLSGVSLGRAACCVATGSLHNLQTFQASQAQALVAGLYQTMERQLPAYAPSNCFAFQMIDGLSVREEPVTRAVQQALGVIPLVGGSAGDDMNFRQTRIFCDGAFHQDAAVLAMIHTELPFMTFMTQHFEPSGEALVVTAAEAERRVVREFNGLPAAEEYARCAGVPLTQLDAALFADRPMVVKIGDECYVRSIQRAFPDGSLAFYCAIEEGVVLRIAQGVDLLGGLTQQLEQIHKRIGPPALILGCECVLRRLEVERCGLIEPLQALFGRNHTIGFCTYGEQYRSLHLNQTMTGIAIGSGDAHGHT